MDLNSTDPMPPTQAPSSGPMIGGLTENTVAALSYITFIPAIIFLVMEPYNRSKFVRFHAFQCIVFSVTAFVLHLVLMFIPIIGWIMSALLSLVFLVLWIMCILKALKGEWYKLPVVGDFAMEQASK